MECAELFLKEKESYRDLLTTHILIHETKYKIQKYFDCVATIMSNQLRQIVFKTLKQFMKTILEYKVRVELLFIYFLNIINTLYLVKLC